ncbi:MAG: protein kinase, partial [Deltaproteobacteria bacterium]|nr:protein kinase [Deltaproteobacteria bacterium]
MARRYRLQSRLEEGTFAEYFKAVTEGEGGPEPVLVKLFSFKVSDAAYARALSESGARTRSLRHPGALGFDEVGFIHGRIAAVRSFVEGHNLGDALRRLSTREVVLPPALALYIVSEAAQVVSAAHLAGWSHGAITPGNVLLGADGRVRVVDFGALEAMDSSQALRPLLSQGRNAYRAPEVKTGRGAPAADVYSLGAIAYELLTMQAVAQARGGAISTKRDALIAPSRLDRRINARIDPVLMRSLDNATSRRYPSAAELSEALRGLFSVLGYAPSAAEAARFVRDLFPNEVAIGGVGGALPFAEAFALSPGDEAT